MKKLTLLRVLAVIIVMLLPLAAATPAAADAPVQTKISLESTEIIPPHTPGNYCDFNITVDFRGTVLRKEWFDQDGNWIRTQEGYSGAQNIIYAYGRKVVVKLEGEIVIEPLSPTKVQVRNQGNNATVTVPGHGIYFGWAGQETYTIETYPGYEEEIMKWVGVNKGFDLDAVWAIVCPYLESGV